jgi:hypothetical protein
MNEPLRGDDLAYATLDYIRDHPEEWDQSHYYCGTAACFAGRALLIAMGEDAMKKIPNKSEDFLFLPGGLLLNLLGQTARDLLGWTDHQAAWVFLCFTKDFARLELRVKQVLNGEIT